MKKTLSVLLSVLLVALIAVPALTAGAADADLSGPDFYLKLMNNNMQAQQYNERLSWVGSTSLNGYANQLGISMAKNEKEAYQVYFFEKGDGRNIRLEVAPYVDGEGHEIPFEIYKEHFLTVRSVDSKYFAEGLIPYAGEDVQVNPQSCAVFYVELRTAPDQPAGEYTSSFTLYEGDEVLRTHEVTATVWDFALPESHYATTIMGLYNSVSGYSTTRGFLEQSGIRFSGGEVIEEDREEAERILEGWQEFLLDHGVTTYEIPRFLIDEDPKAAALAMADTRRKAVSVPYHSSEKIQQYKDIMYDIPYLSDKAFFYTWDEPGWTSDADTAAYDARCAQIEAAWPGYHSVVPLAGSGKYGYIGPKLRATTDIICLNHAAFVGNDAVYQDYISDSWHRQWCYLPMATTGCIAVTRWGKTPMGVHAKAVYWQTEASHTDGLLNWNCGFLPYQNGKPWDIWGTEAVFPGIWPANVNGEGIFVYESKSLGFDPATPIASIRLKHISNGMEDYDYLQLAKEAFGTGADSPYTQAMNKVFQYYTSKGSKYVYSCESSKWSDGGPYEFVGHDYSRFEEARRILGEALSAAGGVEHEYGEWSTVVEPDDTHNGLDVRTCSICGAEESRKTALCNEGKHIYEAVCTDDPDSHELVCVACGDTQTAGHTPKTVEGADPTCNLFGRTDEVVCEDCGMVLTPAQTVAPTGHIFGEWDEGKVATCMETGITPHKQCTVCNKYYDANDNQMAGINISKNNNHTGEEELVDARAATCIEAGYTGDIICSACRKVITEGEEIPVDSSNHVNTVIINKQDATCTAAGYSGDLYCNDCEKIVQTGAAIEAKGHTDGNNDGKCDRCNAEVQQELCPYCHQPHTGFLGKIIGFFHRIAYFFKNLFNR